MVVFWGTSNMFCKRWKFEKESTAEKFNFSSFAKKKAKFKIYKNVKVNQI